MNHQRLASAYGAAAIFLWSTTFAFNRSLAEQLGPITAAASFQALGGVIGLIFLKLRKKELRHALSLPKAYLFGCGSLFVLSQTCAFVSVGLALTRQQAIETSLVYYLWPGLTLIFSIPIFRQRANLYVLLPGIVLAFLGVALVTSPEGQFHFDTWGKNIFSNWLAYLLAATGAITWALYSNFSRLHAGRIDGGAVSLFLLAAGIVLGGVRLFIDEQTVFTMRAAMEVTFVGLFPMLMAYSLWDLAVRRGNLNLVAAMSYLAPFFSALASCIYLDVTPAWSLWLGCVLLISGAACCKFSIQQELSETCPTNSNKLSLGERESLESCLK